MKGPGNAKPARTKADHSSVAREPIFRQVSVFPDQDLLGRLTSDDGGEISGAREVVIIGRGAKPEVQLRDILRHAAERQQPVTSPAPGVAHRVKAVGTNAQCGDADEPVVDHRRSPDGRRGSMGAWL